jgi:3-methyladenine DNA glycosylase Mpg
MCQINTKRTFRWRHLLVKPERTYAYTWYTMNTCQEEVSIQLVDFLMVLCSLVYVYRRFGGTSCLHFKGRL